jgi:hypothetical protein
MHDKYDFAISFIGIIFLGLAVIATYTGEAWTRFGLVVRRDKSPSRFWVQVVIQYLISSFFLGWYLYRLFSFSR